MDIKRMLIAVCLALFIILSANTVFAEIRTFQKEYTYRASDEDSRNSSRTISLREVKRLLLEELGTYLESITEVKNFQLTKDQITTLTAGIVMTEIVEETWDGKTYWLKAKISADPESVIKSIDKLRHDRQKVKELEDTQKRADALLKENERLTRELKTATGIKKENKQKEYAKGIKELNAVEWFEKGYSLAVSGNHNEAIEANTKAIRLNPTLAEPYYNRGIAYGKLGNYQQAIRDFDIAIGLNSEYADAYYNRGTAHVKLGNHQHAIRDFDRAIGLNPECTQAYNNRGVAYAALGSFRQAIKDCDKAIELDSKDAMAYYNRGNAYYRLGNYQQGIEDYNRAIRLNPEYTQAYGNRGSAYTKLNNQEQAIKDYNKAIELNPNLAGGYNNRGFVYFDLGKYQLAINDLKKALELTKDNSKSADTYIGLAISYLQQKNIGEAKSHCERAVTAEPLFKKSVEVVEKEKTYFYTTNQKRAINRLLEFFGYK